MPNYLTAAQVAAIFHCSEKTIYKMSKDGRLQATRIGRLVRFKELDVQDYIKLNTF